MSISQIKPPHHLRRDVEATSKKRLTYGDENIDGSNNDGVQTIKDGSYTARPFKRHHTTSKPPLEHDIALVSSSSPARLIEQASQPSNVFIEIDSLEYSQYSDDIIEASHRDTEIVKSPSAQAADRGRVIVEAKSSVGPSLTASEESTDDVPLDNTINQVDTTAIRIRSPVSSPAYVRTRLQPATPPRLVPIDEPRVYRWLPFYDFLVLIFIYHVYI